MRYVVVAKGTPPPDLAKRVAAWHVAGVRAAQVKKTRSEE